MLGVSQIVPVNEEADQAISILVEQAVGGVGGEPQKIVGESNHETKCKEYIIGLARQVGGGLPRQADLKIRAEIRKMQEAIDWAQNYRAGLGPKIPSWAKPWQSQIEKFIS